jgi:hypothetical protein
VWQFRRLAQCDGLYHILIIFSQIWLARFKTCYKDDMRRRWSLPVWPVLAAPLLVLVLRSCEDVAVVPAGSSAGGEGPVHVLHVLCWDEQQGAQEVSLTQAITQPS